MKCPSCKHKKFKLDMAVSGFHSQSRFLTGGECAKCGRRFFISFPNIIKWKEVNNPARPRA